MAEPMMIGGREFQRGDDGYLVNTWPTLSAPLDDPQLRVVSFGAGVQSSTMLFMAAHGLIGPMPDAAIFADVGWEPPHVYRWLEYVTERVPFPVYIVSKGNLREDIERFGEDGYRLATPPLFVKNDEGKLGLMRRQCTVEYKITPVRQKIREMIGLQPRQHGPKVPVVEQWIGISMDEIERVRQSDDKWVQNRWPLIEAGMDRRQCIDWMIANEYPEPPKSACIGCPYHSDIAWEDMRVNDPESFADAVAVDRMIREKAVDSQKIKGEPYLHRSLQPLDQVDFLKKASGQRELWDDGFINECTGMCGN